MLECVRQSELWRSDVFKISLFTIMCSMISTAQQTVYFDASEGGRLVGGKVKLAAAKCLQRKGADFGKSLSESALSGWTVETIIDNGPSSNRIDVVVLGDGYTASEMGDYRNQVNKVVNNFFNKPPLSLYKTLFNVHMVNVVSAESGVDNDPTLGVERNTALNMGFWAYDLERLLGVDLDLAYDAAALAPDVDLILVCANSTKEGGAGYPGLLTLSGGEKDSVECALHEFGHSFGELADEYDYYDQEDDETYTETEPEELNVSTYSSDTMLTRQAKWWQWLGDSGISTYEGALYCSHGIYRPSENSKMRQLGRPWDAVNTEILIRRMYGYCDPLDSCTPPGLYKKGKRLELSLALPLSCYTVTWTVDGRIIAQDTAALDTASASLSAGDNLVTAVIRDKSSLVRNETWRTEEMSQTASWVVQCSVPPRFIEEIPLSNPAAIDEGGSADFFVSADDLSDPDTASCGMVSIVWYVDGEQCQETLTGAPNTINSSFTLKTDMRTVQAAGYRDVHVKAAALDMQGNVITREWVMRVNDKPIEVLHTVGTQFSLALPDEFLDKEKVTVTGLPTGLKFIATAKFISGVATKSGVYSVLITEAGGLSQTLVITVAALPDWAWGTFNGYVKDCGLASMTVSAAGKVAGKISVAGTNYTFSAASYAPGGSAETGFEITTTAKAGKVVPSLTLLMTQASDVRHLGVATGTFGAALPVILHRNVWKDAGMAAVSDKYDGYYTATLPGNGVCGSGYLAFTLDKAGNVKVGGKLADGTAVSLSNTLILDGSGGVFTVVYMAPKIYNGGHLFGVAEFVYSEAGEVCLRPLSDKSFTWVSRNSQATSESGKGFSRELGISGGWYSKTENLNTYYEGMNLTVGIDTNAPLPEVTIGSVLYDSMCWDPSGVVLSPTLKSGVMMGLSAPAAGKPTDADKNGVWDYSATNSVGLKISLARPTGVFKGSFNAWFDYPEKKHVSKSLSFEGALTPVREDMDDGVTGRGFFLWPDKAAVPGTLSTYAFKWSYDFKILLLDLTR